MFAWLLNLAFIWLRLLGICAIFALHRSWILIVILGIENGSILKETVSIHLPSRANLTGGLSVVMDGLLPESSV